MSTIITDDEAGKVVVDRHGEKIGIVDTVKDDTLYVNPDPDITDKIRTRLGWEDADEDAYTIDERRVVTVTDNEVRLRGDL